MASNVQDELLDAAEELFAIKGFYGASLSAIAARVGLSKPGILHHYPSKEKLYGAVLQRQVADLLACLDTVGGDQADPAGALHQCFDVYTDWLDSHESAARLLAREMLDNPMRAESVGTWYLTAFIDKLAGFIAEACEAGTFRPVNPLAFVHLLVGAQHYFVISLPTLQGMHANADIDALRQAHRQEMRRLISGLTAAPTTTVG